MRTPLLVLAVALLAAGCGQAQSSSAPLGAVETEYVAALRSLQQPLHLPDDDAALVGLGRSACTQLAYDVQHRQSAAASYIKAAAGGDYPTAFAITWSAAQHLCPQSASGLVSPTPTGPEPAQGAFTPAPEPSAAPEASQQNPVAGLNDVGKTESNGGITLTVKAASQTDSILMNESSFRPGSGYEHYTKTAAGTGAKYVVVTTHIVNNAKTSLDLTCGLPVTAKLVDDQQRNFDPIDDLYKLKGNPECNKNLQPGFESDMTWVYRVPAAAKILGWGFQDTTDLSNLDNPYTVVHLQV